MPYGSLAKVFRVRVYVLVTVPVLVCVCFLVLVRVCVHDRAVSVQFKYGL